ncbi:MAG: hypothetical protein NPINA01_31990 [Nitrospinaceae bacterium]|jgi:hypothetical protein|nr:MAG: hypothetical protein NPINA01_31990 [Nitrospinaceae bacterium]
MNQGPKRQHWLPCAYLQFFSIDGQPHGRETQIYFTDGRSSQITSVNNLAVAKYTYSRTNPECDSVFHNMEKNYPPIIKNILKGNQLTKKDKYGLIMMMFDLNLRNVVYENRTEMERIKLYEGISRAFVGSMFEETTGKGNDFNEMASHLEKNWELDSLRSTSGEKFISSDNPSMIIADKNSSRPVLVCLPIHPDLAMIAYDKRTSEIISNSITDDALGILNGLQIKLSVRHTFSDHDIMLPPTTSKRVQELLDQEKPERWIDQDWWHDGFIKFHSPFIDRLEFIKRVE